MGTTPEVAETQAEARRGASTRSAGLVGAAKPAAMLGGGTCAAGRVAPSKIAVGGVTGCAIDSTGALRCWGTPPAGSSSASTGPFVQINGRGDVYGAATSGLSLAFWGSTQLQLSPAPGLAVDQVAVNGPIICAVTTCGTLSCFRSGSSDKDGLTMAPMGAFRQVTLGEHHACALDESGTLKCWGDDTNGQTDAPSGTFTSVTSGDYHSCALASDGHVECWGAKDPATGQAVDFGQATPPTGTFKYLSAGDIHTCGIKDDDTVACWGVGTTNADCQGQTECG
jgi:Regulator of chromosome condensation (RCC1) repeat